MVLSGRQGWREDGAGSLGHSQTLEGKPWGWGGRWRLEFEPWLSDLGPSAMPTQIPAFSPLSGTRRRTCPPRRGSMEGNDTLNRALVLGAS